MVDMTFDAPPVRKFRQHLNLTGPKLIATDFHAPNHSALWCNRMLKVAARYGINELVIAGDGLDMHAFSGWGADPEAPWSTEMTDAAAWLWVVYHSFDKTYWIRGNHEDRLARATNWQLRFVELVDAILAHHARAVGKELRFDPERLVLSDYPYIYLDTDWMAVHPRSYSRIPLRVANQIAMIHDKHVIMAHSHRAGWGWCDDGKHIIIDSGGMFDEDAIQYRRMSITTHPAWNHGFVAYKDNHAALFSDDPYTDWRLFE